MAVQTDAQLEAKALEIKNETIAKANTAVRVGTLFEDLNDSKQQILESGTNIKTINGVSVLGSGNLDIASNVDINTIRTATLETEFYGVSSTNLGIGWNPFAFNSGTAIAKDGVEDHAGIMTFRSVAGSVSNSGYGVLGLANERFIKGGEKIQFIFRPRLASASTMIRVGVATFANTNLPADAIIMEISGASLTVTGRSRLASSESATGTTGTCVVDTWYYGEISVDPNASVVSYSLYNNLGALIWSSSTTGNVPLIALRVGVLAYQTSVALEEIVDFDFYRFSSNYYRSNVERPPLPQLFLGSQRFLANFDSGLGTWNLNGEIGSSFYGFGTAALSTEQFLSGTHSLKSVINGKDADGYAQSNNFQYNFAVNGNDIIISVNHYIPKRVGFETVNDFSFFDILQYKGVGAGAINSPLFALLINAKGVEDTGGANYFKLVYFGGQWGDASNTGYEQLAGVGNEVEIPIATWFNVKMRIKFSDGAGIVQVWQDDVKIYEVLNARTFRVGAGITRLDVSTNAYGKNAWSYVAGVKSGTDVVVYADDFGLYNTNPLYSY